jgi:hypothetical protein
MDIKVGLGVSCVVPVMKRESAIGYISTLHSFLITLGLYVLARTVDTC